jgi:hypothetical protein
VCNALTEATMQKEKNQTFLDGSGTLTTLGIIHFFPQLVYHDTFTLSKVTPTAKNAGVTTLQRRRCSHLYG